MAGCYALSSIIILLNHTEFIELRSSSLQFFSVSFFLSSYSFLSLNPSSKDAPHGLYFISFIKLLLFFKVNRPYTPCLPLKQWKKDLTQRWFVKQVDGPHLVFPGGKMVQRFIMVITITHTPSVPPVEGQMLTR